MRRSYIIKQAWNVLSHRTIVWIYDVSLSSVGRLLQIIAEDSAKVLF